MEKLLKICKILHKLTIGVAFASVLLPIAFWKKIPERIPSHFGASGMADAWSGKSALLILSFFILFLLGLMCIVEYFLKTGSLSANSSEREKREYLASYPMLVIMHLFIQIMFAYMQFCSATCRNLGRAFLPTALVAVFSPLVVYLFLRNKGVDKGAEKDAGRMQTEHYKEREAHEAGETYRTGLGLAVILLPALVCEVYMMGKSLMEWIKEGTFDGFDWIMTLTAIFVIALIVPMFFIRYTLYSDHILVDCVTFGKERIPYRDITAIKATFNPLSSAAMSLKRVQIDYRKNGGHEMTLISPVHRSEFIEKVKAKMDACRLD